MIIGLLGCVRGCKDLQRVAAAINDLYIYGVYPSNYPNLTTVLEQAKDHTKQIIKETKKEIALFDDPMDQYDLTNDEELEVIKDDTIKKIRCHLRTQRN